MSVLRWEFSGVMFWWDFWVRLASGLTLPYNAAVGQVNPGDAPASTFFLPFNNNLHNLIRYLVFLSIHTQYSSIALTSRSSPETSLSHLQVAPFGEPVTAEQSVVSSIC